MSAPLKDDWAPGQKYTAADANAVAARVNEHSEALEEGVGGGPIDADDVTDATTVGKAVIRAANAGAARTAIGAPSAADITAAVNAVIDAAPGALDTLNELAAALGDDPNFASTVTNALAAKAPLASPAFTGTPTGITKAHVGLGSVDNTADLNKPVSNAQLAAILGVDRSTKSDLRSVICKGDSLTEGNQDFTGYTFPGFLAMALGAGVSVTNAGRSGWTSTELGVRDGSIVLTLDAFTLPASGGVAVSVTAPSGLFWNAASINYQGVLNVGGTLYPGTLNHTTSGNTFTFTRTNSGSSTPIAAGATFTSTEQDAHRGSMAIIEAPRNDYLDTNAPTQTPVNIAAMIARQSPEIKRTLVLSMHTSATESSGGTNHTRILAVNAALSAAYGNRFVDTRRYLIDYGLAVNGLTPTTQDNTAIANDTIPPQLTTDNVHPNQYGYKAMAMAILTRMVLLGWTTDKLTALPVLTVTLPTPTVTFDAASLTLSAAVANWAASQGTGTLNQGTGGKQPTVNAADSGGKRWVVFDGVDDELALSAPLMGQPKTVVMLVKARNLSARRGLLWPSGTGVTDYIAPDGSVTINAGSNLTTPTGQVVANTPVAIGVVYSGADSLIKVGSNDVVTGNPGTTSQSSGFTRIGYSFSGGDIFAAIDVSKIVVYPTALNAIQLAQAVAAIAA